MADAHRRRFLRALGAWAGNFHLIVTESQQLNVSNELKANDASGAAGTGVVVTSGVRKLAARAPPLLVLDSFAKMCTIFASDTSGDSASFLVELVTLWLALVPRDAGPRGTRALVTALGYLLHQSDDVLHRLTRAFVRRLAARDVGLHATALLAYLASRLDAPQIESIDSGSSVSSASSGSPADAATEALINAVKQFRLHVRQLKRAPRRNVSELGPSGAHSHGTLLADRRQSDQPSGSKPRLARTASRSHIHTAAPRTRSNTNDAHSQQLALSCILAIDFAPTVRADSAAATTTSTTAAVNALLPHLPVLLDTIFFERAYATGGVHLDIECSHARTPEQATPEQRYHDAVGRFLQTLILHSRLPQRLLAVAAIERVQIPTICSIVGNRCPTLRDDWAAVALRRALISVEPRASAASVLMFAGKKKTSFTTLHTS
jgi:hypothetical protein